MATIRWNFPNGTNGDALTAALAGADSANLTGGPATISNEYPLAGVGSLSARFPLDAGGHLWVAKEGLSATAFAYDLYFYAPQDLGGNVHIAWSGMNSWQRSLSVMFGGSQRRIALLDDTNGVDAWTGSLAVPSDAWIRVSVYGTSESSEGAGDGTGRIAWYLGHDTVPQEDSGLVTNLTTHPSIDRIRLGGKAASSSVTGGVLYVGSWAYDTAATGLIGPAIGGTGGETGEWQSTSWLYRSDDSWGPLSVHKRISGAWQNSSLYIR